MVTSRSQSGKCSEPSQMTFEEILPCELSGAGKMVDSLEAKEGIIIDPRLAPCPQEVPRGLEAQVIRQFLPLGESG